MQKNTKILVLLFLTLPLISFGQSAKRIKEVKERMWKFDDADFKVTAVPDKWKNESAVILAKSMEYQVRMENFRTSNENFYLHRRIRLQDEAAVNEFSELKFESSKYKINGNAEQVEVFVEVKIIKPNGQQKEINFDAAVEMEVQSGKRNAGYKKLAIPDLEPGDIIDYYHCIEAKVLFGVFNRILYPLADKYPTIRHRVDLNITQNYKVNAKSLNGAPELKRQLNFSDNNVYSLFMDDIEKMDPDQKWTYTYRTVPCINFQAQLDGFYTENSVLRYPRLGDKLNAHVAEKSLLGASNRFIYRAHRFQSILTTDQHPYATEMRRYVNLNHKKEKEKEKIIKAGYDHLRQQTFAGNYEDQLLNNRSYNYGLGNYTFITNMSRFLKKKKIEHDLVLVTPRSISDITDLILEEDLYWMIRVNGPKPFYINQFDRFSHFNEVNPEFLGTNAYAVSTSEKTKHRTLKKITIPSGSSEDNIDLVNLEISFVETNPEHLKVKRVVETKGTNRYSELYQVLKPYDYLTDGDLKKHNISWLGENYNRKKREEYNQKVQIRKEQDNKDREESIKNTLESQFDSKVVSYDHFELLQTSIWSDRPTLKYEDSFTLEGIVVLNNSDYLVEAGKLLSKQVSLDKKELERKDDVYSVAPRSFNYNISIKIPEGYTVKGLENFNANVSNATGGFKSEAFIKDGKIIINTLKFYSNNYEKAENWPEIVAFLEAAYNFTLQKLLLTKVKS